jgi:putative hemolysin
MPYLQNGRSYFGRLFVRAGTEGNDLQMRKLMESQGWLMPKSGTKLPSGAQASWFYGIGFYWGQSVWPCPQGQTAQCQYSGYPVCLIPWPSRVSQCPDAENKTFNLDGPMFRPIDGTITLEVRTNDKNEPYTKFPPPPDDPWWQHKTWGKSRKPYDRTAWFASVWNGPTGEYSLTYAADALGWTEDFFVADLWAEDGTQLMAGAETVSGGNVTPGAWQFKPAGSTPEFSTQPLAPPVVGMANPASEYCLDHGGSLEIRSDQVGQWGVCKFPDGSECEEWAYMNGECKPASSKSSSGAGKTLLVVGGIAAALGIGYAVWKSQQPR